LRSQHGVQVRVIAQDLASAAGADALIATLAEQNIQIHTLINNAGFGVR
jgi:short-subunit dehydrogenase